MFYHSQLPSLCWKSGNLPHRESVTLCSRCGSASSHVLQLSLNFVENLILHLFVLAVACAWAISDATDCFIFTILKSLSELCIQLGTEALSLELLGLEVKLVLLDDIVMLFHPNLSLLVLDIVLLELRWAEHETNF